MGFKINGTDLKTLPSNHRWVDRNILGFDGNAHAVYVAPRQYELQWDLVDSESFAQLIGFYQSCSGTCTIDLPKWNSATGGFATYSCTLNEPTYGDSFEYHYGSVKLLVVNVK